MSGSVTKVNNFAKNFWKAANAVAKQEKRKGKLSQ